MAVAAETRAFVLELFEGVGGVSTRAMMGGLAIYSDGRIFGMLGPGDRIYIKAKGDLAARMAAEGAEQFAYARKDGVVARMGYWSLPEAAVDEPEAACEWALASLRAGDCGFS